MMTRLPLSPYAPVILSTTGESNIRFLKGSMLRCLSHAWVSGVQTRVDFAVVTLTKLRFIFSTSCECRRCFAPTIPAATRGTGCGVRQCFGNVGSADFFRLYPPDSSPHEVVEASEGCHSRAVLRALGPCDPPTRESSEFLPRGNPYMR